MVGIAYAVLIWSRLLIVAKDRLSELTSREGDWFLDELCSMSGNVNQLLLLLKDHPMVREEVQKQKSKSTIFFFAQKKLLKLI